MKNGFFKRILSFALCLLMVVTAVPISAGAASSLDGLNFVWPVDTSIGFGSYHGGVDFAAPKGTPIYAAESGTIRIYEKYCNGSHYHEKSPRKEILCDKGTSCLAVAKKANGSYANHAIIEHANGYSTLYAHLLSCSFTVDDGAYVEKGQKIAEMGTSGKSTGYHLHFEMKKNGSSFQPTINNLEKTNAYHFEGVKIEVTVDSNYPTNFSSTAKPVGEEQIRTGQIPVYSAKYGGKTVKGRWIAPGDPCTIHEVYTTGYCQITYPGKNGSVEGFYAHIENFDYDISDYKVNKDGITKAGVTVKNIVYPQWIYPGSNYDAYCWAMTSNYPLTSVTVSITSKDTDTKIEKNWKENDDIPTKVVTFMDLPIEPEEFASLKEGNYTFKISASCKLLVFTKQATFFEAPLSVSKTKPSNAVQGTQKTYLSGNVPIIHAEEEINNASNSNSNSYKGVSSYPIGTYRVKVNTSLNVRKGPGTSYARISSYKNGDTVNVTATNGNWGYTDRGWICLDYTTFVSYPESSYDSVVSYGTGNYVVTTAAGLNCRTGSGTNSGVIKTLAHGTEFSVTQTDGAWGFSPEHSGWLCLQYASYVSALTPSLPVPALPNLSTTTSSEIGIGDVISFKWDAVETADIYNVKLIDANTNADVQSTTISGTNASFKAPYEGKFNVSVSASNSQHEGPAATLYGFFVKGPSTVTFKDWDGKVISTQSIAYGKDATIPASPSRVGYTFTAWDGDFKAVREDRTITATYTRNKYKVTFCDYDGTVIGTQDVYYGDAATAPAYSAPTGYSFVKWDTNFNKITKATTVKAVISWTSLYPLEISTSSAVQRQNKSYIVTSIVNNSPNAVTNARIIAVLKTKENKLLAAVQSENISLAKGEVKNLTLTASYDGMATKAELFVVKADNENIPLAKQLEKTIDQGTAWTSWSTNKPPADAIQTQSRTEYRYRDKQFTTSTSSSLSGWTSRTDVTNPVVSYGAWSGWSAWQDAYVGSSDTVNVRTQTVQSGYTGWGPWSAWQDSWVGGNDLTLVETRNVDDPNSPIYQEVVVGYQYNYFRYSTGEFAKGGSDKATSTHGTQRFTYHTSSPLTKQTDTKGNYLGYGYEYTKPTGGYISVWKDDPFETKITENRLIGYNQKTQYRYCTRDYTYKTQYSYQTRSKTSTYYFWKWGDWSGWSTTAPASNSNREIKTQTTYRYLANIPSNIESTTGTPVPPVTGYVDKAYAGRQALLFVTDKNGTVQFVGQTAIDNNGYYSFTFKTKDEISVTTGDYKVMLSIEGTSAAFELDPIKAPVPKYNVKFVDYDGRVVSEQTVEQGMDATMPAPLSREGYRFIGWDKAFTNIQGNTTITALYEVITYDVVFVDEINDTSVAVKYNHGDTLVLPEVTLNDAYNFLGWDAVLDGNTKVTENMIVNAMFEKKMFTVDFIDFDGSLLESQTVEYGEPAIIPTLENRDNYVFICWNIPGDTTYVTEDMIIDPYFEYSETVATPTSSIDSGTYNGVQTVTLSCETEGAQIYYTTDGTDPLEEVSNARARSVQLNGNLYTGPFELDSSAQLLFTAVKDGMNSSDYDFKTLAINTEETDVKQYTVTVHYGIYDAEYTMLVNEGELISLDETELYNYGYTLDGIYSDAEYKNSWNLETDTVNGETDLYLKWSKDSYTVTFKDMNGDIIETQEVAFGEDAFAPMWNEIDGYIFTGWDTDYSSVIEDITVTATYIPAGNVTSVAFDKESITLVEGQSDVITATVTLGDNSENNALIWQSSDENIAIVDDNGNVTAVAAGTATIFAVSEDSGMSAQCEVIVDYNDRCAALGHTYESVVIDATCTQAGSEIFTCFCGDTYSTEIPAFGHNDNDNNGFCDACDTQLEDNKTNCSCMCHKSGFIGFLWKIIRFLYRLFGVNEFCVCGAAHY